ncbi:AAA family ATPase [Endozoicomonas sp.]|uniref:AAA family ATPase n=1 Tax=Endozoicomonas sp. TaxID=1892382 RepID=UPI003AF87389
MKFLKLLGVFLITYLAFLPVTQADEVAGSPTKIHISYLRQYMAKHHFFNRIQPITTGGTIEQQVKEGLAEAERQYRWILREYPLWDALPFVAYMAVVAAAGGYAYKQLPNWILRLNIPRADIGAFKFSLGSIFAIFSIIPTIAIISHGYYVAFPPELPEENLILAYGAKKWLLDKRTQSYIEDELFYGFWRSPSSDALYRLQKSLDKALRLPFYSKELGYDEGKIDKYLRNYPKNLSERLKLFAQAELIYQQTDSAIADSHYPVYFQGVPGTGKTYAAQKLAEAMGTNLAVVTLDGATIEDIIGAPFESAEAKAGRLLDAIIARTDSSLDLNHHNQILLIDEFDRLFISGNEKTKDVLSFMLKLLNPANRSFHNPYLKTDIRLPDTIILAGNQDIHELSRDDYELQAMASRLDKVVFEGFDKAAKWDIVSNIMIPNKERRFRSAGKHFADFSLPKQGYDEIFAFIETDTDPGLRSLEKHVSKVFEKFVQGSGLFNIKPTGGRVLRPVGA